MRPVTVLVADAHEAVEWSTESFGRGLRADEAFAPGMRWVTVAPPEGETAIVVREPTVEGWRGARPQCATGSGVGRPP